MQWLAVAGRSYRLAAALVAFALLLDLVAAATAYVVHRDDAPYLPVFVSMESPVRGTPYQPITRAFRASLTPVPPVTVSPSGRVRRATDQGPRRDPDSAARYALLQLDRYRSLADAKALDLAVTALRDALPARLPSLIRNPYPLTLADGGVMPAGWESAQTQGLMLSALTQTFEATRDPVWRVRARAVFDGFLKIRDFYDLAGSTPDHWITRVDESNFLWFESHPRSAKSRNLMTGHFFALLGLLDFARIARGNRLVTDMRLYRGGLETARHYLHYTRFANGPAWTTPDQIDRSFELHQLLRTQVAATARATDATVFAKYAERLTRDSHMAFFFTSGFNWRPMSTRTRTWRPPPGHPAAVRPPTTQRPGAAVPMRRLPRR